MSEFSQLMTKINSGSATQEEIDNAEKIIKSTMTIYNQGDLGITANIPPDEEEKEGWIKKGGKWVLKKGADILGLNNGGITSLRR